MKDIKTLGTWRADEIYDEFIERRNLYNQMVGNLYPNLILEEMTKIVEHSFKVFGFHPNWIPEKILVRDKN